ncbi:MAG: C40 family peptidase [Clostridiales bacterium]|jgi:uncharacterized protein YgiM (DUF1202 family)|nr:C40 family peptidase [Clostridiales bacterium]
MSPASKWGFIKKGLLVGIFTVSMYCVPVLAETQGTVTGTNVNLRTSNSIESEVYSQLNTGDSVSIVELRGDYYLINHDNKELFISKDFVTVNALSGKINASAVNIRKYPSTNHEVLSQADAGESFSVIGKSGEWINIMYGTESAFVHRDFISIPSSFELKEVVVEEPVIADDNIGMVNPVALSEEFYAQVNSSDGLKLREFPSIESNIVNVFANGTTVDILADCGDWMHVSLDGQEGYMSREFVAIKEGKRPENFIESPGNKIINYARKFLGTPYVWGGTNLNKGVDCSGFVYSVMKDFGITLNRSSRQQYQNGYTVSKANLNVGDLVFFDTDRGGYISHVGIYIGGGQFIHSSSSKRTWGVTISSLSEAYYTNTYYGAVRIL